VDVTSATDESVLGRHLNLRWVLPPVDPSVDTLCYEIVGCVGVRALPRDVAGLAALVVLQGVCLQTHLHGYFCERISPGESRIHVVDGDILLRD
jgi:hypothetical protein